MKKLLVMFLVSALSLSMLTGCGAGGAGADSGRESQETSADGSQEQEKAGGNAEDYADADNADAEETEGSIRKNGELPADVEELTEEEMCYYMTQIFRAFQTLDTETLSEFTDSDYVLEHLDEIREDEEALAFWNNVVGKMVYFEDSDLLLAKSNTYIFGQWYEQAWKENREIVEDVSDLSKEEVLAIYDQYFEEAPYVCGSVADELRWNMEIVDGHIQCSLDNILECVGYEELDEYWEDVDTLNYGRLLLGDECTLNMGYDHIQEDIPEYETLLSMNLDDIVALIEEQLPEDKKSGFEYDCYMQYYVPEDTRAILQQYFDEKVDCYRGVSSVWAYAPDNGARTYYDATEETISQLAQYNIVEPYYLSGLISNFENDFDMFYNVVEVLIESGELER